MPIRKSQGEKIDEAIDICLLKWGIERIFSIVDNKSSNDVAINYLKGKINGWNGNVTRVE